MNDYLIVNVGTGKPYSKPQHYSAATYSERGAKIVCTKLNKKYGNVNQWEVLHRDFYLIKYPVKMVTRINMMSGLPYEEAEDTPSFCSPASEAYWSK